ncbi:hypothetical protein TruAng_001519 [Truncatella angustata]|nr:hypothetical protein TruAng_001519 [Truncatella angustata]
MFDTETSAMGDSIWVSDSELRVLSNTLGSPSEFSNCYAQLMPRLSGDRKDLRPPTAQDYVSLKKHQVSLGKGAKDMHFSPSLAEITLGMEDDDPFNERLESESLLDDPKSFDDLSLAIRRAVQLPTLRRLRLETLWALSPASFGPHPDLPAICCPSLEELTIDVSMTTPDGRYLKMGDLYQAWQEEGD